MGLINLFKSNRIKLNVSPTGVFTVNDKNLIPLNELQGIGSISDIAENLGYSKWHTIITFESKKFECIVFKRRTKEPIIIFAKDKSQSLQYSDVIKIIQKIDWDFQWRQLDFEDSSK